jgi:parallel beta-helix repeat protein
MQSAKNKIFLILFGIIMCICISSFISATPAITFQSQKPADISGTNIIGTPLVLNYSIIPIGTLNLSTVKVYYKSNDTSSNIMYFQNGTGYSGYFTKTYAKNTSTNFTFNLTDNDIYPGSYMVGSVTADNSVHVALSISTNNFYVKSQLLNISQVKQWNIFEIMANSTTGASPANFIYCNSSYTSGTMTTNPNCVVFGTLTARTTYNHCHQNLSCHNYAPYSINTTSGKLSGVKVTDNSFFAFGGANGWTVYYINTLIRTGATQTSTNRGGSWSSQTYTVDSHVHQYFASANGNSSIYYYINATENDGTSNVSAVRNDLLELGGLPPTAPQITLVGSQPSINITWIASQSPNSYPITQYNITLLNSTLGFNQSIGNTSGLNYVWIVPTSILSGDYFIRVTAIDSLNQTGSAYQDLTLATTINSCRTLSSAGNYILNTSVTNTTGTCFTISSANVVLNCGGYNLTGGNVSATYGIYSTQANTTVQNCNINNFANAIYFNGVKTGLIDNNNLSSSFAYPGSGTSGLTLFIYSSSYNVIINRTIARGYGAVPITVYGSNINVTIDNSQSYGYGGSSVASYWFYNTQNIQLLNSVGVSDLIGVSVSSAGTSSNNIILVNNSLTSKTTGLSFLNGNNISIDCNGRNITGNGVAGNAGIYTNQNNVNIRNCNIYNFSTGISYYNSSYNTILNNTISNSSLYGISLNASSNYNNVTNNIINSNGKGIYVWMSGKELISGNNVTVPAQYALNIDGPSNLGYNVVNDNRFISVNNYAGLISSTYNNFSNNYFSNTGGTTVVLSWQNVRPANNRFVNNTMVSGADALALSSSQNNYVENNTLQGTIAISMTATTQVSGNHTIVGNLLNGSSIGITSGNLSENSTIYWNTFLSTSASYINDTSIVGNNYYTTINGTMVGNIYPEVMNGSLNMSGNVSTSWNASLYYANGGPKYPLWSNTSSKMIGAVDFGPITPTYRNNLQCFDTSTSTTLTESIYAGSETRCIDILANNAVLDCNGYSVNGANIDLSYGIYTAFDNVTVRNCNVNNWRTGIGYVGAERGLIENSNVVSTKSGGYGIYLSSIADYNRINNVTINSVGTGSSYGLPMSSSDHNNITNSIINSINSYGTYILSSTDNYFENITTTSTTSYGMRIYTSHNNTLNNVFLSSYATHALFISVNSIDNIVNNSVGNSSLANGLLIQSSRNTIVENSTFNNILSGTGGTSAGIRLTIDANNTRLIGTVGSSKLASGIVVESAGDVYIDCQGKTMTGTQTGSAYGIYADTAITAKNCNIDNFTTGVYLNTHYGSVLDNIRVTNTTRYSAIPNGIGFYLLSRGNHTVNNSYTVSSNDSIGMFVSGSSNNRLENNYVNSTAYAYRVYGASNNNVLYNNTGIGVGSGYAFVITSTASNNQIIKPTATSSSASSIYIDGGSNNSVDCQGNTIIGRNIVNSNGIYSNKPNTTVTNCVITLFHKGINFVDVVDGSITNTYINSSRASGSSVQLHGTINVIVDNLTTYSTLASGVLLDGEGHSNIIQNSNISGKYSYFGALFLYGSDNNIIRNNYIDGLDHADFGITGIAGDKDGNYDNVIYNNTFAPTIAGYSQVFADYNSTGNIFYWNNFTDTLGLYINDSSNNYYNATIDGLNQGNIFSNAGQVGIYGITWSSLPNYLIGTIGNLPYNSSNSLNKVIGAIDYAPLVWGYNYTSGNWIIDCTLYGSIVGNTNMLKNNVTFNGTGIVNIYGNVTNITTRSNFNNCTFIVNNRLYGAWLR